MRNPRVAFILTHPIQYYSPWFAYLAGECDLTVYYAYQQTPEGQALAGFSTPFEWDIPLLEGYRYHFLTNVARSPGLGSWGGCDTPEIGDIVRNGGFDAIVMIGWNKKCFIQGGMAAWRAGVPLMIRLDSQLRTPRSILRRGVKGPLYSLVLPRAAHYLSPGRRSDDYLRHFRVPDSRIHRLAHMVDTHRFTAESQKTRATGRIPELRRQHGASSEDFVFLFVGKLIEKKRPRLLLHALTHLGRNPYAKRAVLWMAGDGPLEAELRRLADRLALPVAFLGFINQSRLPEVYAAADCLVLPSSGGETWGLVVNEGMACGLPAIVSDEVGCAPDLIVEDATGWTWRGTDPQSLANVMERATTLSRALPAGPMEQLVELGSYASGARQLFDAVRRVRGDCKAKETVGANVRQV